jgi:hypothetical protein
VEQISLGWHPLIVAERKLAWFSRSSIN